jgi:SAM-dependent methyltransferase
MMLRTMRLGTAYFRICFLAAAYSSGLVAMLKDGPLELRKIADTMAPDLATHDALRAWLDFGVAAGVLTSSRGRYALRSGLAWHIADPRNDPLVAFIQEIAQMDGPAVLRMPMLLKAGQLFTLADQQGEIVARSSRITEPLIFEAIDALMPASGAFRVLDVGCGSGTYLRHAIARNPDTSALGLELQPDVAAFARQNLVRWGVAERTSVESGDVRARQPAAEFDLVMLNNNIYYFGVQERVGLLKHLGAFLKPGGCILITTACLSRNVFNGILDLWSAGTRGGGRLPTRRELIGQMREAGFAAVRATAMVRASAYFAFTGRR